MPAPDDESMPDVARGHAALSNHLRRSLALLRERTDNDDFRRLVGDVLAGRAGLRDVYLSSAFQAGLNPYVERFAERYEQLSDAERQELARQGEEQLRAERERIERGQE